MILVLTIVISFLESGLQILFQSVCESGPCGGSYEELSPICGRRGQETTREVGCHQSVEC